VSRRCLVPIILLIALVAAFAPLTLLGGCADDEGSSADQPEAASLTPAAGEVRLLVSRDYGATVLKDVTVEAADGADALSVLTENAEVESAEGFVSAVDGLASTETAAWFFWVDGVLPDVGAAEYALGGGETVWWDLHDWTGAMFAGTAVHAFPAPWSDRPLPVTADTDVAGLDEWVAAAGLELGARRGLGDGAPDDGLVVCTAAEAAATPWLADLLSNESALAPVAIDGGTLSARDVSGAAATPAAAAVVALPNAAAAERPLLLVVVAEPGAGADALGLLTPGAMSAHLAVAVVDGAVAGLPLPASR